MPLPDQPLKLLVRKLEIHSSLSAEGRQAILDLPHSVRTLDPSAYILREGDQPTHCAILLSGFAYRQKLTGEGRRQIVSLHIPGEGLDFQNLFLDVADHNIQVLTRAAVAVVPRAALAELAFACPDVGRAILVHILVEASIFREWVLNVGRRDARTRLAHLLCEFAIRLEAQGLSDGQGYELPMTQEQLGDALGLTPVHVNRTIKSLEADGLISRDRRRISFPRWNELREIADFTAGYLHLEKQAGDRQIPRPEIFSARG